MYNILYVLYMYINIVLILFITLHKGTVELSLYLTNWLVFIRTHKVFSVVCIIELISSTSSNLYSLHSVSFSIKGLTNKATPYIHFLLRGANSICRESLIKRKV
jgi:hypothetical protein